MSKPLSAACGAPALLWCAAAMPHALFSASAEWAVPSGDASLAALVHEYGPQGKRPAVCSIEGRVAAANEAALRLGAELGEETASALSRTPQLRVFYAQRQAPAELKALIAAASLSASSLRIFAADPDGDGFSIAILFEPAASLPQDAANAADIRRQAAAAAAEALCRTLKAMGLTAAAGVGATPEMACAAARASWMAHDGRTRAVMDAADIKALPLEALPLTSAEAAQCRREGLSTADEAAARFGALEAAQAHDPAEADEERPASQQSAGRRLAELFGLADAARPLLRQPASLRLALTLEDESAASLHAAAERLGAAAKSFSHASGAGALRWTAVISDGRGGIAAELPARTSAADEFAAELRSALQHAEPQGAMRRIQLQASPVKKAVSAERQERACAATASQALEAELAAAMGASRVFRLASNGRRLSMNEPRLAAHPPLRSSRTFGRGLLPTECLAKPEPLKEERGMPIWRGPLVFVSEFECASGADGSEREYIAAKSRTGEILWLFRELKSGRWFLEGRFA